MTKFIVTIFLLVAFVNITTVLTKNVFDFDKLKNQIFHPLNGSFITSELEKLDKSLNSTASFIQQNIIPSPSCNCVELICSCCTTLNSNAIFKNKTVCNQITYLQNESALNLSILIDGKALFNKTITETNPPEECIAVPDIPNLYICVVLKNLQIENSTLHACIDVQPKLNTQILFTFQFDCFDINSKGFESSNVDKIIKFIDEKKNSSSINN
ncbi:uncharacterized protein LOC127285809 [Leptopilina boulardi]|uniref:uncharacterized protein LOC127285809 n=1 Tax=Leptopilina boulardi TaxID=63433 RepID=UPI0021F6499B|nr:uncharacterized protein LOC127285809 [Leptopilina boulardi]